MIKITEEKKESGIEIKATATYKDVKGKEIITISTMTFRTKEECVALLTKGLEDIVKNVEITKKAHQEQRVKRDK